MQKNSNLRKLVFIALLTAQGIILGLLEQAIPFPFAFASGAKLGVANIVTLISLYTLAFKEVVLVVVMKTLMTTVLGGTFSTFLYSGMGALVSFIGMYLVMQLSEKRVSVIGVPVYKHIQQFKAVQEKKTTFALAIKNMVMIHSLQAVLLFVAVFFFN